MMPYLMTEHLCIVYYIFVLFLLYSVRLQLFEVLSVPLAKSISRMCCIIS